MRFFPLLRGLLVIAAFAVSTAAHAEDGYDLWLRYHLVEKDWLGKYRAGATELVPGGASPTLLAAKDELVRGLGGLLARPIAVHATIKESGAILFGTPSSSTAIARLKLPLDKLGPEGYLIRSVTTGGRKATVIAANSDIGVLYGAFQFLRLIQTRQPVDRLNTASSPHIQNRILEHWDNLDRTVERGYAGKSLWDWQKLPGYLDPRYTDYARANASIGINGAVLNNVNAEAASLTPFYLEKTAALANVFRPYGIKVYLSARWSAPIELGG